MIDCDIRVHLVLKGGQHVLTHSKTMVMTHAVRREVQLGLVPILKTVVEEELIDSEVTEYTAQHQTIHTRIPLPGVVGHLVHTGMREVGENIGEIETGHGEFGDDHLGEGGECASNRVRLLHGWGLG